MINKLIYLFLAVVIVGLIAFGIDYAMMALGVALMWQRIVWLLFGLIVLLGIVGYLGYGPLRE